MFVTKIKAAFVVVLILGIMATGATILTCWTAAGQEDKKVTAEKPVEPAAAQEKEREAFTAWGKEINGLQAGLGFRSGEHRAYHYGETVTLVVRIRNVGKDAVKFQYLRQFFMETPPTVTDGEGKRVEFRYGIVDLSKIHVPVKVNLAPGKGIELYEVELLTTLLGTGKFTVQYERVFGNSSAGKITLDPTLNKLATGKLELEVKDAEKLPEKTEEKEAFTAWGKEEVGGLQAGLGFRPGEKRAYRHGEEATVVLRVRNVGKEAVEFKHIGAFFVENPPTITDADGKGVQLPRVFAEGLQAPHSTNVAPGKEVELYEWNIHLLPKGATSKNLVRIHGTGKFSLQCERIVGPTSGNPTDPNPTLNKLATGKLELEVKSESPPAAIDKK